MVDVQCLFQLVAIVGQTLKPKQTYFLVDARLGHQILHFLAPASNGLIPSSRMPFVERAQKNTVASKETQPCALQLQISGNLIGLEEPE